MSTKMQMCSVLGVNKAEAEEEGSMPREQHVWNMSMGRWSCRYKLKDQNTWNLVGEEEMVEDAVGGVSR